ncbi:zinc knuckle (CCHC-type) family protein isoform X2 [Tasmannia lanceolata]|uniref:zinc knuckle (CCHC-type) family protein isoform X2 n=1 Tax=Tasmannia lanceolata TaxID=3420 RepID=UPI004062F04C
MDVDMEGTALDAICIPGYPIEQFITQKSNTQNSNRESMKELGHSLDSTNQCIQRGLNKDLGAGANASPREDNRYMTTHPLSELVWSPHRVEGTCGDVEQFPKRMKVSFVDTNHYEDDCSAKNDMILSSPGDTQINADALASNPEKSSIPEEMGPDFEPECEVFTKGMTCNQIEGEQYNLPKRVMPVSISPDSKHAKSGSLIEKECRNKITFPNFVNHSHLVKPALNPENGMNPLTTEGIFHSIYSPNKSASEGVSACAEMGTIMGSEPKDVCKDSPERSHGSLAIDKKGLSQSSPNNGKSLLKLKKDKVKASSDTDVNQRISKEENDSHESVESCNSGRLFSTAKRAWSFERQVIIGSKKIKKQHHKSSCSDSFPRQDISFMNWISNMVKGFSKFDPDDMPTFALSSEPFNHRHKIYDSHSSEQDKHQGNPGCRSLGFQNFFEALYCPKSLKERDMKTGNVDSQTEAESSKELEGADRMPCDNGSIRNEESMKLIIPISKQNISSDSIAPLLEKPESKIVEHSNSCNIACGFDPSGVRPHNSSFENDSASPSDSKMSGKLVSVDPNGPLSLESRWITRFSSKAYATILNSVQGNQNLTADLEGVDDTCRFLHKCQNDKISVKGQDNLEDGHGPSVEEHRKGVSRNIHNNTITPTTSYSLKRTEIDSDQKFKSKLSPIQPSQRLKYSEAMASVFARRLDALGHIGPSKVGDNGTHATTICFFCGTKGHTLRDCSDIIESDLERLTKNGNLYDESKELSCLCIRCFQLNHWAIACPFASTRKKAHQDFNSTLETSRVGGEFAVHTNVNNNLSRTMINNERVSKDFQGDSYCEGVAANRTCREFLLDGDRDSSYSEEDKSKRNQSAPFCNYVRRQIPAAPRGIFETIKRLRLSRTDILKWMRSPTSNFRLEGFFLRLRLGKWEKGLGGTGYHVACISGLPQDKSCGTSEISISVDIGGLKCLVGCRYVSNHDFIEEELMAWWCATLKGDGKLPSEEDLNMKLEEKTKYGF